MISCSLSPNTEPDDVWLALCLIFLPWKWKRGAAVHKVEQRFGGVSFNSGRSALLAILRAFQIGKGDEVIVQAFTCVAVPNSVRWAGATPIYADIDDSLNMNPSEVFRKITKKTKAIIVQHTFGRPAAIDEIIAIAQKNNLVVIEDFAHTMSLPMKGDAAFYSFGRDKVLSSVFGGLAMIDPKHSKEIIALKNYHKNLEIPSYGWIFQQLFHPVAFSIILPLYQLGMGKLLLICLQKIKFLSFPVYKEEKMGKQPSDFPAKYPNALALLLVKQLKKLDRYTKQRKEISSIYGAEYPYLRFPKLVENSVLSIANAKKQGVLLGNWYHNVIDPGGYGYTPGSCPNAEEAAAHIVNLPTRISQSEAHKVLASL